MRDGTCAQNAKNALNGQNIYNGCCTLQIDFSKLNSLEVKFNNEKSRDYTNLLLPSGGGGGGGGEGGGAGESGATGNGTTGNGLVGQYAGLIGAPPGANMFNPQMGNFGAGNNGNSFQNSFQNGSSFNQMKGGAHGGPHNQHQGNMIANSHNNNGNMMMHHGGNSMMMMPNDLNITTPVLLVTNLNEEFITPEALFTLFGVYGDVVRVKVLFNKKDSALINFVNTMHASTALANLDRVKLWNKQIRVFPSKHVTVQMPKDGQPDAGLTKDFTNSPLHRFKKPGSKNFNNIFPPSPTLHLSNIPANVEEDELKGLFAQFGTVKGFRFFQKDRKMALVQMASTEEAITALIATHNHQLAENMHLRVAFSKATVN